MNKIIFDEWPAFAEAVREPLDRISDSFKKFAESFRTYHRQYGKLSIAADYETAKNEYEKHKRRETQKKCLRGRVLWPIKYRADIILLCPQCRRMDGMMGSTTMFCFTFDCGWERDRKFPLPEERPKPKPQPTVASIQAYVEAIRRRRDDRHIRIDPRSTEFWW